MAPLPQLSTFTKLARELIIDAHQLKSCVKTDGNADALFDSAKQIADQLKSYNTELRALIESEANQSISEEFIGKCAKANRDAMFELIKACRSAKNNPYDFLAQQTVDAKFAAAVHAIKQSLSAAETHLQKKMQEQQQQEAAAAATAAATAEGEASAATATPVVTAAEPPPADDLQQVVVKMRDEMDRLSGLPQGERMVEAFLELVRALLEENQRRDLSLENAIDAASSAFISGLAASATEEQLKAARKKMDLVCRTVYLQSKASGKKRLTFIQKPAAAEATAASGEDGAAASSGGDAANSADGGGGGGGEADKGAAATEAPVVKDVCSDCVMMADKTLTIDIPGEENESLSLPLCNACYDKRAATGRLPTQTPTASRSFSTEARSTSSNARSVVSVSMAIPKDILNALAAEVPEILQYDDQTKLELIIAQHLPTARGGGGGGARSRDSAVLAPVAERPPEDDSDGGSARDAEDWDSINADITGKSGSGHSAKADANGDGAAAAGDGGGAAEADGGAADKSARKRSQLLKEDSYKDVKLAAPRLPIADLDALDGDRVAKLNAVQQNLANIVDMFSGHVASCLSVATKPTREGQALVASAHAFMDFVLQSAAENAEQLDCSAQAREHVCTTLEKKRVEISKTPTSGTVEQETVAAATSNDKVAATCCSLLLARAQAHRETMRSAFAQVVAELGVHVQALNNSALLLQLASTCVVAAKQLPAMLHIVETYAFAAQIMADAMDEDGGGGGGDDEGAAAMMKKSGRLSLAAATTPRGGQSSSSSSSSKKKKKKGSARASEGDDGDSVWDAEPEAPGDDMFGPGSLNQLIIRLTHETNYDAKFMKCFLTTYKSFTDAWTVWTKLKQRYDAPPGKGGNQASVRLRCIVVLKSWIESQLFDFDDELIVAVLKFCNDRLPKEGKSKTAEQLARIIRREQEARRAVNKFEPIPASAVALVGGSGTADELRTPIELLRYFGPQAIAEQLTLIDWTVFKRIKPSELLNQAWNKPKLKYRAPNVLMMIDRANALSYWVASLILWSERRVERSGVYTLFVELLGELMRLSNFCSVMGVLAGLNMSSVHRLRYTSAGVSGALRQQKAAAEQLLSPQQSFKRYREAIHSKEHCVPYLGVWLTDITFIEDGNPNFVSAARSPTTGVPVDAKGRPTGRAGSGGGAGRPTAKARPTSGLSKAVAPAATGGADEAAAADGGDGKPRRRTLRNTLSRTLRRGRKNSTADAIAESDAGNERTTDAGASRQSLSTAGATASASSNGAANGTLATSARTSAANVDAARFKQLTMKMAKRDFDGAKTVLQQLNQSAEPDALTLYNLGLCEANLGNAKESLEYLRQALQNGYDPIEKVEQAKDFECVRALPYWRQVLDSSANAMAARRATLQQQAKKVASPKINFKKNSLVYSVISEVQLFQQVTYQLERVEPLHTLLLSLPPERDEDVLYKLSLMREPRGAKEEDIK